MADECDGDPRANIHTHLLPTAIEKVVKENNLEWYRAKVRITS